MSKRKDTESADRTEGDGKPPEGSADASAKNQSAKGAQGGKASGGSSGGGRARSAAAGRSDEAAKTEEAGGASKAGKGDEAKAGDTKAADATSGKAKSGEPKSGEPKSGDTKTGETKAGDTEAGDTKTGETKAAETEAAGAGGGKSKRSGARDDARDDTSHDARDDARDADTRATPASGGRAGERPEKPADEAHAGEHPADRAEPDRAEPDRTVAHKGADATRADELAYHDATIEELGAAEERGHRTVWSTLFFILLGAIIVAAATLWAAPKVAPYLPASLAQYLVPGQVVTTERLEALEAQVAARAEETDTRLDALAAEVEAAADADEIRAALAEVRDIAEGAAEGGAQAAAAETQALAERIDGIESRLAAAREELDAVSDTLTGGGEGTAPPELAAALAALRSRVDQLAANLEDGPPTAELAGRLSTLAGRVDELEASLADAQEASTEASGAIRQTRLQSALDTVASRLAAGQAFAAPLGEAAALAEAEPPEALAAAAEAGVATAAALEASFGRHAQEAIAAAIRTESGDGPLGGAVGWLRAQLAGRPVSEQEGDGADAVTSRIAARLAEGRLDAALAEAETLSEPARAGLGDWLEQLRARVAAERALAGWRDQVTARG